MVDRSIKIALTTCEQIVKKDFALDSDETRMRVAAHHMVRNLTAGMAMITCRDQLLVSISTNLKQTFLSALMVSVLKGSIPKVIQYSRFVIVAINLNCYNFKIPEQVSEHLLYSNDCMLIVYIVAGITV